MRFDLLVARVRGEYREMPGLRLTLPQACRLWQLEAPVCETILDALVEEGYLARTPDGAFVALDTEESKSGNTSSRAQRRFI